MRPCETDWRETDTAYTGAAQKFAAAYAKTVFLKFYGNHSEGTKHLFETRLQTPMTPTFTFWRQGKPEKLPLLCQPDWIQQPKPPLHDAEAPYLRYKQGTCHAGIHTCTCICMCWKGIVGGRD